LDIADGPAVRALAKEVRPDTIIHLAALQIPACRASPVLGAQVNVVGHIHVLDAARETGARLIYTSSVAAKPRGPAHAPANLYGVYKRTCEEISGLYAADFGVASLGLRPHVVYGVGRDQGETSAITAAIAAAAFGRSYTIPWTTRTCFQYAGDIAAMFVAAVAAPWSGSAVSDMTDVVESTEDVMVAIRAAVPSADVVAEGPERLSPTSGFDVATLEAIIGRRRLTPLCEGVAQTVAMFRLRA
jgi:nucleoside-diphosphate-sugar epimerase